MALLLSPGTRIADASGNPLSGAKVRVYLQNTTTLASLYSDAALSVPLSNPVITNSAGYPATNSGAGSPTLVFCANANYDIAFLDSSNNVLAALDDATPYGSDQSTLEKDFTNSRFQVTGTGGTVHIEVGDQSPDDTGGTGRLGGWDGTQGDDLEVDFAATNFTGAVTVGSKKLPALVQTAATSFSGVANIDIALPETPTNVRAYEIMIWDLIPTFSANNEFRLRFSYDNGSTYKSGGSDYDYVAILSNSVAAVSGNATYTSDTAETYIYVAAAGSSVAPLQTTIRMTIITPDSGTGPTHVMGEIFTRGTNGTSPNITHFSGSGLGDYGRATHVRILVVTGTANGKYLVRSLLGTGD